MKNKKENEKNRQIFADPFTTIWSQNDKINRLLKLKTTLENIACMDARFVDAEHAKDFILKAKIALADYKKEEKENGN